MTYSIRTLLLSAVLIFGAVGFADASVELRVCSASLQESEVEINWTTAAETSIDGIRLQRRLSDGSWTTLGFVELSPAPEPQSYRFIAPLPTESDTLTYRFQLENSDGNLTNACLLQVGDSPSVPVVEGIALIQSDETIGFGSGFLVSTDSVSQTDTITVSRFSTGPSDTDGIQQSNVSSYRFTVQSDSLALESDAEIRLQVDALPGISEPTNVKIYKRSEEGTGSFTQLPTSFDSQANELVAPTGSFSEFVLASDSEPLPVELTDFGASLDGNNVRLSWETGIEKNNAGFEVQRRRGSEPSWKQVGYVESKARNGTTTEPQHYEHNVKDLSVGIHQFRLRQVDLDGSSTLTDPIGVEIKMQNPVKLISPAPNPVSGTATFSFAVKEQGRTTIQLYNTLGQKVATVYQGSSRAGELMTNQIDASHLPSGSYFLVLRANGKTVTRRVSVVR